MKFVSINEANDKIIYLLMAFFEDIQRTCTLNVGNELHLVRISSEGTDCIIFRPPNYLIQGCGLHNIVKQAAGWTNAI